MNRHPGGMEHTLHMLTLASLPAGARVLDMGAGAGEAVAALRSRGYDALGIDLEPRGKGVARGDYLRCPYGDGSFDAILSQCSFYTSGDVPGAVREAGRLLKPGGVLMLSDIHPAETSLADLAEAAGLLTEYREDQTAQWRQYFIQAIWEGAVTCIPRGKFRYTLLLARKPDRKAYLDGWMEKELGPVTRQSIEAAQLEKLNALLPRLRARGGAYRDVPEHLDSLEELCQLPRTTAQQLGAGPMDYLLVSQSEISRIVSGATSGTAGPSKRVFFTDRDIAHTVGFFAAGIREMLKPGEKCLIAFPFTGPGGLGDMIAQAVESLGAIPVRAGYGQSYGQFCNLIEAEQPQTYIGFPVWLLSAARMYGQGFPIQRALVSADACPQGLMDALEAALGCRPYPHYGSREMCMGGAVTCPAFRGMHLRENHILAELLDERGDPVPEGAVGELTITTLDMEAMPLLRYRTGDFTRFLPPCPCGCQARRIGTVSRPGDLSGLDSALFSIPALVDHWVSRGAGIRIEARTLEPGLETVIREKAAALFPGEEITVTTEPARMEQGPMYPGKRYWR